MTQMTKGKRANSPTAQERRINQLEAKVEFLDWLHAELVYSTKVALAQLVIKMNPDILQLIAEKMVKGQIKKGAAPQ
jgi:uncharacterized coiled-coil protein SlyX